MSHLVLRILLFLYDLLYILLSPFIFLYLLSRKDSRKRLTEYLGLPSLAARKAASPKGCLLVHAVSVGEVLSVVPIVEKLKEELQLPVVLSTTIDDAETISKKAPGLFNATTFNSLDFSPFVRFFLKNLNPYAIIVSETDLWPNLLLNCKEQYIPVYLTNGRLSDKIAQGALGLGTLAAEILLSCQHLFVQRKKDEENLLALGLPKGRVTVSGNTKYESATRSHSMEKQTEKIIEKLLDLGRSTVVGGSTHEGEEDLLFKVYSSMPAHRPRLIIAPRIIERADEICQTAKELELKTIKWTELIEKEDWQELIADQDLIVIDVLGELGHLYHSAKVVFIGGTFNDVGGHNFLEACACSKAVVIGPNCRNFSQDLTIFLSDNALVQVTTKEQFINEVRLLLEDEDKALDMGERARAILISNQGAAERTAKAINDELLALSPSSASGKNDN